VIVIVINSSHIIVNVVVEPCEYGLPRCPHCNGASRTDCDSVAVIEDCQSKDVSHCML